MQITITGPRGCGKTTIAMLIGKVLRQAGCDVHVFLATKRESEGFQQQIERETVSSLACRMDRPAKVAIVDSHDHEDETDVRGIPTSEPVEPTPTLWERICKRFGF